MRGALQALALLAAGWLLGWLAARQPRPEAPPRIERDTITETRVDTIIVAEPRPIAVSAVRVDTIRLASVERDTIAAAVPITQAHYADTAYEAWVSGYMPRLDSLRLYPRSTIETITIRETRPAPRWSLGAQAGVGLTPRGLQPYIGVGISYRIDF